MSFGDLPVSCPHRAVVTGMLDHPGFFVGSRVLNSGPRDSTASPPAPERLFYILLYFQSLGCHTDIKTGVKTGTQNFIG